MWSQQGAHTCGAQRGEGEGVKGERAQYSGVVEILGGSLGSSRAAWAVQEGESGQYRRGSLGSTVEKRGRYSEEAW
jgi:hypothetical protein